MNWLINTLGTSIGKKLMMAITGLCFCCFLIIHLAGNLTLYGGQDLFNAYAEHLHSLGPLITISEWILVTLAIIHVLTGATLFYQNYRSRPVGYTVNKRAGGRSLGSATMPYTGFVLFAFIIFHLVQFHFTDKANTTIYQMVANAFADPVYVCIYVAAMIIADHRGQSPQIHAHYRGSWYRLCLDCRNRLWVYSHVFYVYLVKKNFSANSAIGEFLS